MTLDELVIKQEELRAAVSYRLQQKGLRITRSIGSGERIEFAMEFLSLGELAERAIAGAISGFADAGAAVWLSPPFLNESRRKGMVRVYVGFAISHTADKRAA